MTIVVLPFNAAKNTRAPLARQFANFACDIARGATGAEINAVNYLAQYQDDGVPRFALVNPGEELNEPEVIEQFSQQAAYDLLVDGLLSENENGGGVLTVRFFDHGSGKPKDQQEFTYMPGASMVAVRCFLTELVKKIGGELPAEMNDDEGLFGTTSEEAFLKFLAGFDSLQYIDKAQGRVVPDFSPEDALAGLTEAVALDKDWEAPYMAAVQLGRLCTRFRIGTAKIVQDAYTKLTELEPQDGRAFFALGELYENVGENLKAAEALEKAHVLEPEEPAILTRLGIVQMAAGMPVNAERNFRKAIDLEDENKPSMDYLAQVLDGTGRGHEVPALWKGLVDASPQNAEAQAKYAISLLRAGREADGLRAFDLALETLEDNTLVKRFYAPVLKEKGDLDRAMDLYEDCLDVAPTDIVLLIEYAQTLSAAGRDFEVPKVLNDILSANPDANTRAQTQAWLIELEQPKRVEAVKSASEKADKGDFSAAIDELTPLRNWLADYWKMWAVLATSLNQAGRPQEAEEAARHLLELFPACEPGYGELMGALGAQGRHDEAYSLMRMAMGNMPHSLAVAINFAIACKRAGKLDEARGLAEQLLQATNNSEDVRKALAEVGV